MDNMGIIKSSKKIRDVSNQGCILERIIISSIYINIKGIDFKNIKNPSFKSFLNSRIGNFLNLPLLNS